jgi:phytoene synthase
MAWWRERLEELDAKPAPAEPRLQAVALALLPLGISGSEIAELEAGWASLLDSEVDAALVAERGSALFRIGGRLLGSVDPLLREAGALYALASVGRRGLPQLLEPARPKLDALHKHRFERRVRPLTMLARASARDLKIEEPEGSPRRAAAMLAHRWSGRIG